jgi:hypothetical protein
VLSGRELLSEAEEDEEDILDKAFDVRANSRLGCQAKLVKEGVVEVRGHAREPRRVLQRAPQRERPAQGLSLTRVSDSGRARTPLSNPRAGFHAGLGA